MILVINNGKIIGVDKTLLKILNVDLHNLSSVINKIELEIAALKNKHIQLNNTKLKVVKKEVITIEDIDIFDIFPIEEQITHSISPQEDLSKQLSAQTQTPAYSEPQIEALSDIETIPTPEPKIEIDELIDIYEQKENKTPEINELVNIEPEITISKPETPEISIEQPITPAKEETHEEKPVQEFEESLELNQLDLTTKPEVTLPQEETIPPVEETLKEMEISISFEDEISEVEKILELSDEEAKKLIQNDLNQAKEELGIDDAMANELLQELYKQIESEKNSFQKALKNADYDAIHKTAHKLKGAALNLRLSKLAYILKIIDEKSKQGVSIGTLKNLINKFYEFFNKINGIKVKPSVKKSPIPVEIQNLIKKTLQEYLETQNEKKFKKDKKYIEKLLNKKINSIEDLKNILKGNE